MSVLACNRDYCENVMCSRMSVEHGYICDECFNELVGCYMRDTSMSIKRFMTDDDTEISRLDAIYHLNWVFRI